MALPNEAERAQVAATGSRRAKSTSPSATAAVASAVRIVLIVKVSGGSKRGATTSLRYT